MKLVVLTKKWGRDFSGATLATQHFVDNWISFFEVVEVYTLYVGDYKRFDNLIVKQCASNRDLVKNIKLTKKDKNNIYYSDDHLGYLLHKSGVNYLHTYHGNWPDARLIDFSFFIKSFYFIPKYKKTIKNASMVISVSRYMESFIKKHNPSVRIIHNGIDFKNSPFKDSKKEFLMVGNVDSRKYGLLIEVLKRCKKNDKHFEISIYGRIDDKKLANKLGRFKGVCLMGMVKEVPYKEYRSFLNVSSIENLSISVCEAIHDGLNVVCFRVGGLSEVVEKYEKGYITDKKDYDAFLKNMEASLKNDLVPNSSFIEREFDWDKSSREYVELFKTLNN